MKKPLPKKGYTPYALRVRGIATMAESKPIIFDKYRYLIIYTQTIDGKITKKWTWSTGKNWSQAISRFMGLYSPQRKPTILAWCRDD